MGLKYMIKRDVLVAVLGDRESGYGYEDLIELQQIWAAVLVLDRVYVHQVHV